MSGLGSADAATLLASAVGGRLDAEVRDRIVAETRGNPLALLQLPRGLGPAQLAGGFWLPDSRPLASRIEDSFHRQFQSLPRRDTAVAADRRGRSDRLHDLVVARGELQDIPADAVVPAQAAGLVELGAQVHFGHPLVRSAVYQAASAGERREAHRVLAEATDPEADPDRRAWHRAHATVGPDAEVADELERSAGRARRVVDWRRQPHSSSARRC